MSGIGTMVNGISIVGGALLGLLLRKGLPERIKEIVMQAIGLSVIVIGFSGILQGIFFISEGGLERQYLMTLIFSMVLGGVLGGLIGIERRLDRLGKWVQVKLKLGGNGNYNSFAKAFVFASLLYCVGAMAIVGALEDGLMQNPTTLFSKSILDGISAIVFTTSLGIGVAFSALPVLIYQGSITLLAGYLRPFLTAEVVSQMSLVGSILIVGIGLNILEIKKIRVGDLLPAIFLPLVYYFISLNV